MKPIVESQDTSASFETTYRLIGVIFAEMLGFEHEKPEKNEKNGVFWCAVVHCARKKYRIVLKICTHIAQCVGHIV